MTCQVVVLRRAERELDAAADWIAEYSPEAAARWFSSFVDVLLSLENNPQRCGFAPKNDASSYELRQLIYRPRQGRTFRAIFTIKGNQVRVLRIRGAGQDLLAAEDLDEEVSRRKSVGLPSPVLPRRTGNDLGQDHSQPDRQPADANSGGTDRSQIQAFLRRSGWTIRRGLALR